MLFCRAAICFRLHHRSWHVSCRGNPLFPSPRDVESYYGSEIYLCCIPRHIQCTLIFYWPPSNLNLTTHRSRRNAMKCILLLMLLFYTVASMTCFEDHCLSFYPLSFGHCVLRIPFTPLVSSNLSYIYSFFKIHSIFLS